jgi:hypothetical protein
MAPPLTLTLSRSSFEVADELLGDDGEGLVDLPQVDVVEREAGLGQHLAGRRHRRVEHQRGAVAHVGHGDDAGARLEAVGLLGVVGRGQQHGGRAVDHARRVAGVVDVLDLQVGIPADQRRIGGALGRQRDVGHRLERGLRRQAFAVVCGRGNSSRSSASVPSSL